MSDKLSISGQVAKIEKALSNERLISQMWKKNSDKHLQIINKQARELKDLREYSQNLKDKYCHLAKKAGVNCEICDEGNDTLSSSDDDQHDTNTCEFCSDSQTAEKEVNLKFLQCIMAVWN